MGYIGKKMHGTHACRTDFGNKLTEYGIFRIDIVGYQDGKLVIFILGNNGVQDIKGKH